VSRPIRRATPSDAPLLAQHRVLLWREVGGWGEELQPQIAVWTSWMRAALGDGRLLAWIAEDDGAPVASAALLIAPAVPRPSSPAEHEGRVHGVYVEPSARRRGLARALMGALLAHARAYPLVRLVLHPSDEARPLYATLGFLPLDEVVLRLAPD
jgi:GNAT superfamily N-acetyltransferase